MARPAEKFTNHHRWFLQNMLSMHTLDMRPALDLFIKTMSDSDCYIPGFENQTIGQQQKTLRKFIMEEINPGIEPLNLRIKLMTCEASQKLIYVIYAINESDVSRAAGCKVTTKPEREYLRACIKGIVTSKEGHITSSACLNLTSQLNDCKITKRDAATFLTAFLQKRWLTQIRGHIFLGPRVLAEMKKYLMDQYADFFSVCLLCKNITLVGDACPSGCGLKLHRGCLYLYLKGGASHKCIKCKEPWPFDIVPDSPKTSEDESSEGEEANE